MLESSEPTIGRSAQVVGCADTIWTLLLSEHGFFTCGPEPEDGVSEFSLLSSVLVFTTKE